MYYCIQVYHLKVKYDFLFVKIKLRVHSNLKKFFLNYTMYIVYTILGVYRTIPQPHVTNIERFLQYTIPLNIEVINYTIIMTKSF